MSEKALKRDWSFPFLMAFTLAWHFSCCHVTIWLTNVFGNHQVASPPWFDLFVYIAVVVGWEHVRDADWQAQHLSQQNSHINEFVISGFSFTETLQKTVIILVYIFYIWAHRILINQMSFGLLATCLEIYCQRLQLNSSRDAQSRFWNRNSASAIQPSLTLIRHNHLEDYKEKELWARRHHEPSWNEMAGKV